MGQKERVLLQSGTSAVTRQIFSLREETEQSSTSLLGKLTGWFKTLFSSLTEGFIQVSGHQSYLSLVKEAAELSAIEPLVEYELSESSKKLSRLSEELAKLEDRYASVLDDLAAATRQSIDELDSQVSWLEKQQFSPALAAYAESSELKAENHSPYYQTCLKARSFCLDKSLSETLSLISQFRLLRQNFFDSIQHFVRPERPAMAAESLGLPYFVLDFNESSSIIMPGRLELCGDRVDYQPDPSFTQLTEAAAKLATRNVSQKAINEPLRQAVLAAATDFFKQGFLTDTAIISRKKELIKYLTKISLFIDLGNGQERSKER